MAKIDRIHTSCDILDRIHHLWKIRPNFSHLYSPIMSRLKYSSDFVKREDFNDILHGCGKIDLIRTSCDILDRKRHMWKIRPNFSQLYSPQMSHLFDIWPNIAHVSKSIEFFIAVKKFHRIRHSHDIFDRIHHMWKFRLNFSHIFAENITCKISHWIYQTCGIRSNTSQMWTIRPNSSQLWHIRQKSSHVKNPTEFLTHIFADNATCNLFDRLYQTWVIQWYSAQMWKNRSNSYKLWHIGQKTSHVKNPTEFLTPIFAENIKCKSSDWICQTWGIWSNTSQMWTIWPNSSKPSHIQQNTWHVKNPTEFLTPIFYQNVSHVRNSTVYVTCEEFDPILQGCETMENRLNSPHSCDTFDRKHHIWKIRSSFSHL